MGLIGNSKPIDYKRLAYSQSVYCFTEQQLL